MTRMISTVYDDDSDFEEDFCSIWRLLESILGPFCAHVGPLGRLGGQDLKKWSISWGWLAFPRACAATSSRSFSTTRSRAGAGSEFSYYIKTRTARAHMITQSLTGTAAHLSLDYPRDRRRPSAQVIARRAAVSAVQRAQRRRRRPSFCLSVGPSAID